jgi:protein CrcB
MGYDADQCERFVSARHCGSAARRLHASPSWRAALAIGFCGAYTTFSTFSFETARLLQHRQWTLAIGNILGNLLLSLFAIFLGFGAAHWLLQARR